MMRQLVRSWLGLDRYEAGVDRKINLFSQDMSTKICKEIKKNLEIAVMTPQERGNKHPGVSMPVLERSVKRIINVEMTRQCSRGIKKEIKNRINKEDFLDLVVERLRKKQV